MRSREGVTAFIGAGLSARQFGTWAALHRAAYEAAGMTPVPFDPGEALVDFYLVKQHMGEPAFLDFMKARFGQPVPG